MRTPRWFVVPLIGLAALAATVFAQAPAPVALPQGVSYVTSVEGINEYRLPNGLRVLLFADPTKDNVTVNITYMVGSRHENYGETGMAHLLEHMLFKGSTHHTDIPKELKDHGARPNGTTWVDRTNYFETFHATDENLTWALELEADRMVNSFIAKKDLDSEMTVVRNEYEAGENSPQRVLMERVQSTAYLWHNYGKSTIGARSDIERVPIEHLQAFYHHFYQPDNAVLVVAGKIDEAKTLAQVTATFGPIPKPARELRRTYTSEPTQDGERGVTLRRVGDVQAICIVHHVPAGSDAEFPAVQVAANILGDNPSGRLYKAAVVTGRAATIGAGAMQLRDPGLMVITASVRTEKSIDDVVNAITTTLDEIKSAPFTDAEVQRAKTQWEKGFELMMRNSEQVALGLTSWQAQGDWRLLFLHRDRMRKLTAGDVQQAALKYFVPSNRTIGRFIPDNAPARADIADAPDVAALLKDYKGGAGIPKGEAFDASPENIDRRTQLVDLPGGLKLSLLPKKTRGEQVHASIALHFGDATSLRGKQTIATATGRMLMRGTTRHTREQIKDTFDALKAQVGVSGGLGGADARITTTRENLKPVLELVAEILREPSFPEKEAEELRQQELAGLENQRSEPGAIASLAITRALNPYPQDDVRYVQTLDERIEAVKGVTVQQLKQFHTDFYGASAGEVVVVGDFDPADVQQLITRLFGDWKSPQPYTRIEREYHQVAAAPQAFETPDKANAVWLAAMNIKMSDTDPDYPAMVLSSYIIGSGMNSRLFARIRNKEGLSYGVGAGFNAPTKDEDGGFFAQAICAPQNAQKVEASFKDEIDQILGHGFTPQEVAESKKSWLLSRQVSRAEDEQVMRRLSSHRYWGRHMTFDAELEQRVMALTPEDLQAGLRRHLDLAQLLYYRAGDFKKANVAW
jgi:zinc protease